MANNKIFQAILAKAAEKKANDKATGFANAVAGSPPPAPAPTFAGAVAQSESDSFQAQALNNIKNLALLSLGAGAAGRGAVGLVNLFKPSKPKIRSGPVNLPLPYPAEEKVAYSSTTGIPWYMPAMMTAGLGGVGIGWSAVDKLLASQRNHESDRRLEESKQQFHDALLSQYSPKAAGEKTAMQEVGERLDRVWEKFASMVGPTKTAVDFGDMGGKALGGYGTYALLSGLLGGTWAYDATNKRSRRSVIEKALRRRQQAEFAKSPPPLVATPEPIMSLPHMPSTAALEAQAPEI